LTATGSDTYSPLDKAPKNNARGQLQLSQPLVSPPAWPLYSQAKHELEGQRAQSSDDKRQLAFDAAKAYLSVLLADQVVQAAQHKLDTAKADVDATDAQFRAQLVSSNDVTRAQISFAGSQRELAADQGSLEVAYQQLALVINAPVPHTLRAPAALLAASARKPPAADTLVAAGLRRRPDLAARRAQVEAADDFAREPRYRWFPTLVAQATMSAASSGTPSGHDVDASLSLNAAWTLFDAGVRTADARSRTAQLGIAILERQALVRTIDMQVRAAAAQLVANQQALAGAQTALVASRKSADETAILYHQGLAKAIELVDANEQRFLAEVNYAEAQFAVASAYLAVLQAMGASPVDTEVL
jgi:outer membrane protein TolC